MKKNLPKELDFAYEARNAEKVAAQFSHFPWLKVKYINGTCIHITVVMYLMHQLSCCPIVCR